MSTPPYFPGLPPGVRQASLDRWSDLQRNLPRPVPPPLPVSRGPVAPPRAPASRRSGDDPLEGRWVTQDGAWHFTRDANGYAMTESSALGKVGEGRATRDGPTLVVDYSNVVLGRVRRTLRLDGDTLQGSASIFGITVPLYFRRG